MRMFGWRAPRARCRSDLRARISEDELGSTSGATGLQHVALLYDDVDRVAETVADIADRDLAAGSAVLLCTPPGISNGVQDRLGPAAGTSDRFVTIPAGARYARPIDALSMLWRTMSDLLRAGAPRVHSIGEIAFAGGPRDDPWMWYEAAVGDVFRDDPLTATCLFDTGCTPPAVLDMACCTHAELRIGSVVAPSLAYGHAGCAYPAPEILLPGRAPDVRLPAPSVPADARALVTRLGTGVPVEVRERAQLVVTELVANAITHAGGATTLSMWFEPKRIFLCVEDDGPGVDDPFATLRPPGLSDHGRGLWLSHHAASELSVRARPGGGTRAAAVID
jgi:hypothetical protein